MPWQLSCQRIRHSKLDSTASTNELGTAVSYKSYSLHIDNKDDLTPTLREQECVPWSEVWWAEVFQQGLNLRSQALSCFSNSRESSEDRAYLQSQQPLEPALGALRDKISKQTAFFKDHSQELEASLEVKVFPNIKIYKPNISFIYLTGRRSNLCTQMHLHDANSSLEALKAGCRFPLQLCSSKSGQTVKMTWPEKIME